MTKGPKMSERTVEQIARRLSEAQREQVLRGSIGDCSMRTVESLIRKGLFYHHIDSPNGMCGPVVCTELGLALRQHLMEEGR